MALSITPNPKCKVCEKTAYPLESIQYDSVVYHKHCFKCLQCGSTVSLKKVAMIQGDLYCKNCFIRMFSEKGNYKVFLEKNQANSDASSTASPTAAASTSTAHGDTSDSASTTGAAADSTKDGSASDVVDSEKEARATANYLFGKTHKGSVISCLIVGCGKPRVTGLNYCTEHQRPQSDEITTRLLKAVDEKNVDAVKQILNKDGVTILLQPNSQRQSPLEYTVASGNNALGALMVETLLTRFKQLEEQVRVLQDQLDHVGTEKLIVRAKNQPRRRSAPKHQIQKDLQDLDLIHHHQGHQGSQTNEPDAPEEAITADPPEPTIASQHHEHHDSNHAHHEHHDSNHAHHEHHDSNHAHHAHHEHHDSSHQNTHGDHVHTHSNGHQDS